MTRLITERQERIYRMRHHDFDGLTTKQVASKLNLTMACVTHHMRQMRKIAPQLFPILTEKQANVYNLYVRAKISTFAVAKALNVSVFIVKNRIYEMRRKGMFISNFCKSRKHDYSYESWMDNQIVYKF